MCVRVCVCACHMEGLPLAPWLSVCVSSVTKHGQCEPSAAKWELGMMHKTRKRGLRGSGWGFKSGAVFLVKQDTRHNSQNWRDLSVGFLKICPQSLLFVPSRSEVWCCHVYGERDILFRKHLHSQARKYWFGQTVHSG